MGLEELIKMCAKGDRQAQEELYRSYSPVLYGICLKYARNKMEAEDNLHDSFMTIFEKIGQYKSKGSFEGWIKRITVNTILQKFRKEEHLRVVGDSVGIEEETTSEFNSIALQTLLG
ncbi:MAG: RNA polymerase sigma factor, partial [Flavobacteriaceae bacterium]